MRDIYSEIPDHEHTCGECVRYHENARAPGIYMCSALYGPKDIDANRKACEMYWDRAEQLRRDAEKARKNEEERQSRWRQNENNAARPAKWERDWDYIAEKPTGAMPFCPNCAEPLYELDRCYYCGQAIEEDDRMREWKNPPEIVWLDCFGCGGKGTMKCVVSKYNGHKHGTCTVCGARFME